MFSPIVYFFFVSHQSQMDSDSEYSYGSDAEDEPLSARRDRKARQNGSYQITNALKVPRATTYTAQALYGEHATFVAHRP